MSFLVCSSILFADILFLFLRTFTSVLSRGIGQQIFLIYYVLIRREEEFGSISPISVLWDSLRHFRNNRCGVATFWRTHIVYFCGFFFFFALRLEHLGLDLWLEFSHCLLSSLFISGIACSVQEAIRLFRLRCHFLLLEWSHTLLCTFTHSHACTL